MNANKSKPPPLLRSALSRISSTPRPPRVEPETDFGSLLEPEPEPTGTTERAKKVPPPLPKPAPRTTQVSTIRMAPALVFVPEGEPTGPNFEDTSNKTEYSTEYSEDEKTPVHSPYRIVNGKVVDTRTIVVDGSAIDLSAALPSSHPPPDPCPPSEKTIPETPLALLARVKLPPQPVLNVTWVENRGTRIRNAVSFFLLACFLVTVIAGATWAFLWNGRNHQQLLEHQREEREKEDHYR